MKSSNQFGVDKSRLLTDFLIIGAQKCGTTWLYHIAKQHPKIFMTNCKKVHFFNKVKKYKKGIEYYESYFEKRSCEKIAGEATPKYFWTSSKQKAYYERTKEVPKLVKKQFPRQNLY
ncbi:sulfotransferase domain-containing protein [Salinibacter sp.]|uniref:sulfotransferase domain-containing protein n=1 Tax=Salinibacter sp. TaxID=2065818 RepID=UPI003D708C30